MKQECRRCGYSGIFHEFTSEVVVLAFNKQMKENKRVTAGEG